MNNIDLANGSTTNRKSQNAYGGAISVANYGTLTLENVDISKSSAGDWGGAVHIGQYGTFTATNSTFTENSSQYGGAIFLDGYGTATLDLLTFYGNKASSNGGGIYWRSYTSNNTSGSNLTFENNTAKNGAGIFFEGNATIADSSFKNNVASNAGGGIYLNNYSVKVVDSLFEGNSANYGGGINNYDGAFTGIGLTFLKNEAQQGGGFRSNANSTIIDSTFKENRARYTGENGEVRGGAISVTSSGSVIVYNSAIIENVATDSYTGTGNKYSRARGGGVYNEGTLTLVNTTVAGNSAVYSNGGSSTDVGAWGGGIYTTTDVKLENSIVASNFAINGVDDLNGAYYSEGSANVVGFAPGFAVAPDFDENGTIMNAGETDYRLAATSQAIDRGVDALNTQTLDLDGNPRVVGTIDLGAWEYQGTRTSARESVSLVVDTLEDVVNDSDGKISLREAILYAGKVGTIAFDASLKGGTIQLTGAPLYIGRSLTIDASNLYDEEKDAPGLTIRAAQKSNAISISGYGTYSRVNLKGLAIVGGSAANGAGVYVGSNAILHVENSSFSENVASNYGGAIYSKSKLELENVSFTNNAANYGAGVFLDANGEFSNVKFTGNVATYQGGGIYLEDSRSLTLTSGVFTQNKAKDYGGGVVLDPSTTATLTDVQFVANTSNNGGGLYAASSLATLKNVTFEENEGVNGGGFYSKGTSKIFDSSFTGNQAQYGGGLYVASSTTTVMDSTFTSNSGSVYGGGVHNRGTLHSVDTTFKGNSSTQGGGIYNYSNAVFNGIGLSVVENKVETTGEDNVYVYGGGLHNLGTVTLEQSEFVGNSAIANYTGTRSDRVARSFGGGIYNSDGTLTAKDVAIVDNSAKYSHGAAERQYEVGGKGGGFSNSAEAKAFLYNVTIAGNEATIGGGLADLGRVSLYNSIVAENASTEDDGDDVWASESGSNRTTVVNSIIANGEFVRTEEHATDPRFFYNDYSSVGTKAAPIDVKFVDSQNGDYRLTKDSPAIDSGASFLDHSDKDLDGNARVQGVTLDLGAYEFVQGTETRAQETPTTVVTTALDVMNPYDGLISLREAIAYADAGDVVTFNTGVFVRETTICLNGAALNVDKALTIQAPDAGLTLDACGLSRIIYATKDVTLQGFTFTNGFSDGNGGAIYLASSESAPTSLTILDSKFENNISKNYGGAVFTDCYSKVTIRNAEFVGNTASNHGGGVFVQDYSTLTLTDSSFTNNSVVNNNGGGLFTNYRVTSNLANIEFIGNYAKYGGGAYMYSYDRTSTLTNVTFTNNRAEFGGGGLYAYNGVFNITDATFTNNVASYGGGFYLYYGVTNLNGAEFDGNSAEGQTGSAGGAITVCSASTLNATNVVVTNNRSYYSGNSRNYILGGGIHNAGTLRLTNSLVTDNLVSANYLPDSKSGYARAYGGGIANYGTLTCTNVTLAGNLATYTHGGTSSYYSVGAWGGGLYNSNNNKTTTINNTIIVENSASSSGADVKSDAGTLNANSTLSSFEAWSNAATEGVVNYKYDVDASMFLDFESGDYRLAFDSQALNRGSDELAVAEGLSKDSTDLAGEPRYLGDAIDLGAYESLGIKTSQKSVFAGELVVTWAPYKNATSTTLTWKTADETLTLVSGGAEGELTWDTTKVADKPGQLVLQYFDDQGSLCGTATLDALVLNAGAIVVDALVDSDYDGKTSLNEAITLTEKYRVTSPILFDSSLAGQTIDVDALTLETARIDGGTSGVTIKADSVTVARTRRSALTPEIRNLNLTTGSLNVSSELSLVDSTLTFVGESDARLGVTGVLNAENVVVKGSGSTWNVTNKSVFKNVVFQSNVVLNNSTLNVVDRATFDGTFTLANAQIRLEGIGTFDGSGAIVIGGNSGDALVVYGDESNKATLTFGQNLTLQGSGKILGEYFEVVNNGRFELDGALAFGGDFTLGVSGELSFGARSLKEYAALTCVGNATLAGQVVLERLSNAFVATQQDVFKVLKAASLEILESATFDADSFSDYAQMQEETTSDTLSFTVGYLSGPKVVSVAPSDNSVAGLTRPYFDVYFDQGIDASSFTASDVVLLDENGEAIEISAPKSLNKYNNAFRIYLPEGFRQNGTFDVTIGPDVRNTNGIEMNQDGSPPNGGEEDAYSGTFTLAFPNLSIRVDESALLDEAYLGAKLEISLVVTNDGVADALGSWKEYVYLSKDATLSADDYLLASPSDGVAGRYSVAIASGATSTKTIKPVLPLDNKVWTEGDYYLIVKVDAEGAIFETNEEDNSYVSKKISLAYPELADLTVTSIIAPENATPGQTIEIIWTTANEGERDATENWYDKIYVSTDGSLENATLIKTVKRANMIAAGESAQQRASVAVPSTGFTGEVCFVVVCDSENDLLEEDEENNSRVSSPATILKQTLNLSLSSSTINEGTSNVRGVISRTGDVSAPLTVTLVSSDASELVAPETVTIAAGQASAAFYYSAPKDGEFDDDVYVELAASADGFDDQHGTIRVVNVDKPELSLSLSKRHVEEGEEFEITVKRNYVTDKPITVRLTPSTSKQLTLPSSVTIAANESSVVVTASAKDDDSPESAEDVKIIATSPSFVSASKTISVTDDDEPTLAISLESATVVEGAGGNAFVGTVTRAEAASSALRVRLTSSRSDKIGVPSEVTIPAGKTSVTFYGASYDNGIVDGEVDVKISATGVMENCNCSMSSTSTGTASTSITVLDDDGARLTLSLDHALMSEGKTNAATLTVKRNTSTNKPLTVSLTSSSDLLTLPNEVTIPAGSLSATVSVSTGYCEDYNEESWITIEGTSAGFVRGTALALVTASESPDLCVTNVEATQDESDLGTFHVSYLVFNQGKSDAEGSWVEKIWASSSMTLDDDATLVATFVRNDKLSCVEGENGVVRTFDYRPTEFQEQVYWHVSVDYEDAIRESCETNNYAVSGEQTYKPPYAAVVQTDVEKADPATSIPMYGYAYNEITGKRMANADVTVVITNGSTTRTIDVTTDEKGEFTTTWEPLSSETGAYTIGACRSGVKTAPVQDEFSLMKLDLETTRGTFNISEGETVSGSFKVYNNSADPIVGLGYAFEDVAENLRVSAKLSSTTIPAGGYVTVTLTATALDATTSLSQSKLRLTSSDTKDAEMTLTFNVYPGYALLTTDTKTLSSTMKVGEQKVVEFDICNESGVATGPITVDLPELDWLSSLSGTTLESLAPGEARTVKLLLNPGADLPQMQYQGSFVLRYQNTGLQVDFKFRARSDNYADLTVKAVDEYYYYTEDAPTLAGASVKVVDSITKQIVSTGVTGDDGQWVVKALPEGYYDVYVSADDHNNYSETIYVDADDTLEAFLTMQTVKYEWTVTPTTIEDEYDITVDVVYETNVPAPVLTASPTLVELDDLTEVGQRKQIDFVVENHGLIALYDVMPVFNSNEIFKITPLVEYVDVLSAKSSYTIPVVIERVAASDDYTLNTTGTDVEEAADSNATANEEQSGIKMNSVSFTDPRAQYKQDALAAFAQSDQELQEEIAAEPLATTGDCSCTFIGGYTARYICGEWQKIGTPVAFTVPCPCKDSGGSSSSSYADVSSWSGGSQRNTGGSSKVTTPPNQVSSSEPYIDDCTKSVVETLTTCALGFAPKQIPCLATAYTCYQTVTSTPTVGSVGSCLISAAGCAATFLTGGIVGLVITIAGCAWDGYWTYQKCTENAGEDSETIDDTENPDDTPEDVPVSDQNRLDDLVDTMYEEILKIKKLYSWTENLFGDEKWFTVECSPELENFVNAFIDVLEDVEITQEEEETLRVMPVPKGLSSDDVVKLIERWKNSFAYYEEGYFNVEDLPEGYSTNFIDYSQYSQDLVEAYEISSSYIAQGYENPWDKMTEIREAILDYKDSYEGVCTTVKLELKQKAVLTRDAFDAQLVLENLTPYAIQDVYVNIIIYDQYGNDVTDKFGIYDPTTSNFYNADVDNLGDLEGNTSGQANWIFVPSTECAKDGAETYSVGGVLHYIDGGQEVSITMSPASITVYPQPELDLVYFWQRDAIADDPWTEEVEESEPFELAVLVKNNGNGTAKNLRIISAQPEIVENEKGLLIDFKIVGSQLNGENYNADDLTINFGDVEGGGSAVGQWFLETTLQGHFIDYSASFQHVNGFDDLQFSLIKSVEIHELIHTVKDDTEGEDSLPDFLVNDVDTVADMYDLPDTLYLSDGSVESVATTTDYEFSGELSAKSTTVKMTVNAAAQGWNYVWANDEDPGGDEYELVRVVRSDGKELDASNFWQTHRTFVDGREAFNDNTLHILDYFDSDVESCTYTLYYEYADETGPTIAGVEELPSEIRTAPVESVEITFDEPIDSSTFTVNNLTLTRGGGRNLIDNYVSIEQVSDTTYRIKGLSAATRADGVYELSVSTTGIADLYGNLAETNVSTLNWTNAVESPFVSDVQAPDAHTQETVDSIVVTFTQSVDASSFTFDDLTLTRDNGTNLIQSDSGVKITAQSATVWKISGLGALTALDGEYALTIKSTGVRSESGKRGVGVKVVSWEKDVAGLSNATWSGVNRETTNYTYDALYLAFDEEVDFNTLNCDDFTLTRNGTKIALDYNLTMGVLPESLKTSGAAQEWKLVGLSKFASQDGEYVLTVDLSNVADLAGNKGKGTFSVTWTVDAKEPEAQFTLKNFEAPLRTGAASAVLATAANETNVARAASSILEFSGETSKANSTIRVYDESNGDELYAATLTEKNFDVAFDLGTEGLHNLRFRITDPAGNWTDYYQTVYVDQTAPFVTKVETGVGSEENFVDQAYVFFSETTNIQSLIDDGSIVDVVFVQSGLTGEKLTLDKSDFQYDASLLRLAIDLSDVDVEKYGLFGTIDDSKATVSMPFTLLVDSSKLTDAVGNLLRGTDLDAANQTPLKFVESATLDQVDSYSVPSLVDWNGDGLLDLLVGEKSSDGNGRVKVCLNEGTNDAPSYADGFYAQYWDAESNATTEIVVSAGGCQGAAPRAVDVDGDGALDLFVGLYDGTILFYRGEGSGDSWKLTSPEFVEYGVDGAKSTLDVGDRAVFEICDWNQDGRVDLLVGSASGKLYLLVDSATEGLYNFQSANVLQNADGSGELTLSSGRTAPTLADVDGDGAFDIITGNTNGALYVYLNAGSNANPKFSEATALQDADGAIVLDVARTRPFACDYDGDGVTDLILGASDGSVTFWKGMKSTVVNSEGAVGDDFVCSVTLALDADRSAPKGLTLGAYDATTRTVAMNWTDNADDEVGFRVEYSTDGGKTWRLSQTLGANVTSRVAWGVKPNAEYDFRVCVLRNGKQSRWSYSQTLDTTVKVVTPPGNVTLGVYDPTTQTVAMSWQDNSDDETNFRVEYSTDGGQSWRLSQILDANVTSRVAWKVQPNATYEFRVCALRGNERSKWAYSEVLDTSVEVDEASESNEEAILINESIKNASFDVPFAGGYALALPVAVPCVEHAPVGEASIPGVFEDVSFLEFEVDDDFTPEQSDVSNKSGLFIDLFDDDLLEIEL